VYRRSIFWRQENREREMIRGVINNTHRDLDLERINNQKTTNIRGERMEALGKA
jgi:hypothetical protein